MPSVRNVDATPSPDSSNVVLFEMMMHYKQEAEHLAAQLAKKEQERLELLAYGHEQHVRAIGLEEELDDAVREIQAYEIANRRGSEIIVRKHEAGMLMLDTFDTLMGSITVAKEGDRINGRRNDDVRFIAECATDARAMMDIAVDQFMTGWYAPGRDIDMTSEEVVDLTGEETETDEEM